MCCDQSNEHTETVVWIGPFRPVVLTVKRNGSATIAEASIWRTLWRAVKRALWRR